MPIRLIWTNQAREDLLDIYLRIADEQPTAAERYLKRIEDAIFLLSEQPRMGAPRNDLVTGLRALIERPYLIFYRLVPDSSDQAAELVEIVRVIDGRRDLPTLF